MIAAIKVDSRSFEFRSYSATWGGGGRRDTMFSVLRVRIAREGHIEKAMDKIMDTGSILHTRACTGSVSSMVQGWGIECLGLGF